MTDYKIPPPPGASSDEERFDYKANIGALLRIEVREFRPKVDTSFGPADAIAADVVILDGPNKGSEYPDSLLFGKVLTGQLQPLVGGVTVVRLNQGEKQPGKNPAWLLTEPTAEDIAVAQRYDAYKAKQAATAPSDDPF